MKNNCILSAPIKYKKLFGQKKTTLFALDCPFATNCKVIGVAWGDQPLF